MKSDELRTIQAPLEEPFVSLKKLPERYCVVLHTLPHGLLIQTTYSITQG